MSIGTILFRVGISMALLGVVGVAYVIIQDAEFRNARALVAINETQDQNIKVLREANRTLTAAKDQLTRHDNAIRKIQKQQVQLAELKEVDVLQSQRLIEINKELNRFGVRLYELEKKIDTFTKGKEVPPPKKKPVLPKKAPKVEKKSQKKSVRPKRVVCSRCKRRSYTEPSRYPSWVPFNLQ